VSSVFRRSSNASSLHGPETHVRHSRDPSWRKSMLNMRTDTQEDVTNVDSSASSIPLPSSPIAIPTPAPKLKLDFDTSDMLSPFAGMTDAVLTEIKVLQDPRNITTGRPSSGSVAWALENTRPCPSSRDSVVPGTLSANIQSKQASTEPGKFKIWLAPDTDDPFSQTVSPITVPGMSLQSEPSAMKQKSSEQTMPKDVGGLACASYRMDADASLMPTKPHDSYTEVPSALEVRNPNGIEDFAGVSMRAMSDVSTTPAKPLVLHAEQSVAPEEEHGSLIEVLELPPPLFSLETRSSKEFGDKIDYANRDTAPGSKQVEGVAFMQQPAIAPSVSALSSLIADAAQQSREDTSIETPVTAGLSRKGSCSVMARKSSESSYEVDDTPMKAKAWSPLAAVDLASFRATQDPLMSKESDRPRKDSLFGHLNVDNSTEGDIPQHGPPSPTRKVKLPLRLKTEFTSRASYKSSIVFKPNLDRAAAKQLGVFRTGSDPSLRQRYFPHFPVSPVSPLNHARQSSLDSDDGGTPTTQSSSELAAIFERAVETPSPLQIRKQPGFTAPHFSSPGTPKEGAADLAHAPSGSSPIRTPSMGDRHLFDLQRAERNACYNAIQCVGADAKEGDDSDLQLADFDNAGPGSKPSSPKRNNSEESIDMKAAEFLLEQALTALSRTQVGSARSAKGRVMFSSSRI
jgi:hypothetical protein